MKLLFGPLPFLRCLFVAPRAIYMYVMYICFRYIDIKVKKSFVRLGIVLVLDLLAFVTTFCFLGL